MTPAALDGSLTSKPPANLACKPKIRLAHVQLLPLLSGVQRVTLDLLSSLDPAEFSRTLICSEPGPLSHAAEAAGIECRFVPQLVRPISPRSDLAAYRALRDLFAAEKFDIVHTNSSKPGVVGRLAARAAKVPVVVHTVHGFAFPAARSRLTRIIYRTAERICRPMTDALICLNESDQATAAAQLGFLPQQLHKISNGVDIAALLPATAAQRDEARRLLGCADDRLAVAMVGRLWPQKNPVCFVEMADLLIRQGASANFYLIGDGELRAELQSEIQRRGLVDRVVTLGWRDDVPQLLHGLDVFVLTSRWEGLPLVILEAQACGVPVVAADIPGNRDALVDGRTGLLAETESPTSFAAQVARLLNDPSLRREFAAAARASAEQNFNLQSTVAQMRSLYVKLFDQSLLKRLSLDLGARPRRTQ